MIIWPEVPFGLAEEPKPTFSEPQDTIGGCLQRANALTARTVMLIACEDAGRHAPGAASEAELTLLPQLRTNYLNGGAVRYCPMCWSVFLPDGRALENDGAAQ